MKNYKYILSFFITPKSPKGDFGNMRQQSKLAVIAPPAGGLGVKYILALFLVTVSLFSSAQDELNNYLKIGAENNPELKVRFNEYMAALELAPQVNALPDPQVAFGYFISPVETRVGPMQFKLTATQMFPWFGTLKAKENAAIQAAKAKYELFEETKSLLFNDVKAAYFNLWLNKKAMAITIENLKILETFQSLAEIKIEAGKVSMVDGYRLEMELNELKNQLALLKDKERFLETAFNNLLDVNSDIPVEVPDDLWTNDFPLSKQAALDSVALFNHQLLSLEIQQSALAYKREVAKQMGKPNINVGFDYTFIGKGNNNLSGKDAFVFPMVGITIPLYRNKYKAMIQEVTYLEAAKTDEKINKTNLLETLFEKGWNNYLDANRRIELYKKQLELAQKSMHLLETEYITGSKNFEEILRMERKVLAYNLEGEKAKADKQAAISFINYLMGK